VFKHLRIRVFMGLNELMFSSEPREREIENQFILINGHLFLIGKEM
jgi:hypothetical protein